MISIFKAKDINYYTHRLKQERPFRVVIKNLHHSTSESEIIEALAPLGHVVQNVSNIRDFKSKEPLPMFYVDLEPKENNKEIYEINKIEYQIVKIEPPHKKREIPQCKKCQRFGHTQNSCGRAFRCVKCTGNHLTVACTKTTKDLPATCVNCGEDHPANYRGCEVYQKLLLKRYPALRKKQTVDTPSEPKHFQDNYIRKNFSYANAVKKSYAEEEDLKFQQRHQDPEGENPLDFIKQSFTELKAMFKDMMQQNMIMVNLLTSLVSKLPFNVSQI